MNRELVVFIESNTSGTGYLFMEKAHAHGFSPVLFTSNPGLYRIDGINMRIKTIDTEKVDVILDACYSLCREGFKIAGILSTSEYYLYQASVAATAMGLPSMPPLAVRRCRDKQIQREIMQQIGLPTPKYYYVSNPNQFKDTIRSIPLPAIVKPVDGSGSFGVKLCGSLSELEEAGMRLLERTHNERGLPVSNKVLIEEYIEGDEYSIEMIGMRILGITRKHLGKLPHFVETGHDFPADVNENIAHTMCEYALAFTEKSNLQFGAKHIEVRVRFGTPYIIEVNPRLAGGNIPVLMKYSFGNYDVIDQLLSIYTGNAPLYEQKDTRPVSIRFCVPQKSGNLNIPNLSPLKDTEGVLEVKWYLQAPKFITLEGDFRDRVGHVIFDTAKIKPVEMDAIIQQIMQ